MGQVSGVGTTARGSEAGEPRGATCGCWAVCAGGRPRRREVRAGGLSPAATLAPGSGSANGFPEGGRGTGTPDARVLAAAAEVPPRRLAVAGTVGGDLSLGRPGLSRPHSQTA